MAFAITKILPLFVYPLGLVLLLLILALVGMFLKRKIWRRVSIASISLAIVIIGLGSSYSFASNLVRSLEWQYVDQTSASRSGEQIITNLPNADAIVVLGGGTRPHVFPRPTAEVAEAGDRILYGAKLWQMNKAPLLVVTGGRADWLGDGGNPESADMAAIATALGVPATSIIQESESFNTRENAINVAKILEPRQITNILLVTSALHMPRSMAVFKKVGFTPIAAPTDFAIVAGNSNKNWAGGLIDLLPSAEVLDHTTDAIKEYIGMLIYQLKGWA
ncbi:protein of unknown function DUF218 [Thalassoporum mexicanum PCC 7367]|uniref:YdcF family protein n=1 Tax=Thalassoporum mexicanum TaxID=3457544 RepID=UPI00029FE6D9|nr:YdcF family protein [Pseudanabaena sp. PCC 7367]AFY68849.1 protein of unknown function DUF218 [Pseudanabaena sp. PCC 7367]